MEAWKKLTIGSEGLQSANIELVALLKKRRTAYALLFLFPFGLHRDYLEQKSGAWAYRIITVTALLISLFDQWLINLGVFSLAIVFALYDLRWIDDQVAKLNKAARLKVYKKPGLAAPKQFRGHFLDSEIDSYLKEKEDGSPIRTKSPPERTKRIPSFSEQEAMLKELQKSKNNK